jgi:hypothetical protein
MLYVILLHACTLKCSCYTCVERGNLRLGSFLSPDCPVAGAGLLQVTIVVSITLRLASLAESMFNSVERIGGASAACL